MHVCLDLAFTFLTKDFLRLGEGHVKAFSFLDLVSTFLAASLSALDVVRLELDGLSKRLLCPIYVAMNMRHRSTLVVLHRSGYGGRIRLALSPFLARHRG